MFRSVLCLSPALALVACHTAASTDAGNSVAMTTTTKAAANGMTATPTTNTETTTNNMTTTTAGSVDAGGSFVSPGHWEGTVTFTDVVVAGVPPEVADQIKRQSGQTKTFVSCVTAADVKDPGKLILAGGADECKIGKMTVANGMIDTEVSCAVGGNTQTMAMTGTYGADSYHVVNKMTGTGAQSISMTGTMDAKRTGECTGNEPQNGFNPK